MVGPSGTPTSPNIVKFRACWVISIHQPLRHRLAPGRGWADDAAFLSHAFWQVYDYIEPHHIADADRDG